LASSCGSRSRSAGEWWLQNIGIHLHQESFMLREDTRANNELGKVATMAYHRQVEQCRCLKLSRVGKMVLLGYRREFPTRVFSVREREIIPTENR
jgi:hypothetical protein